MSTITPHPPKRLRFDFFQVQFPKGSSFDKALTSSQAITVLASRIVQKGGDPIRWEYLEKDAKSGFWTGDITKIRDDVVPNKASRAKPRERLAVAADEGTTEDTVFGYDPVTNVLVCHSNRYGVTGYDIVAYFAKIAGVKGFFDANVILTKEGVEALAKFEYFDYLTYKVAVPKKGPIPKVGEVSADTALEMAKQYGARYSEVTMSVGRSKNKIDASLVTRLMKGLLALRGRSKFRPVRKLIVSGIDDAGEWRELDLIKNRLVDEQMVPVTADRDLPYGSRKAAVKTAFGNQKVDLVSRFGSEADDDDEREEQDMD